MQAKRTTLALGLILFSAAPNAWCQAPSTVTPGRDPVPFQSPRPSHDTLPSGGPTTDEQTRTTQELGLKQLLVNLDAAATLMGRGQVKEAIDAYLPLLKTEPNFASIEEQRADLTIETEALQKQIFEVQRGDVTQSTPEADRLATRKNALEGQLQADAKLIALEPTFAEAHANLAHLLVQTGANSAGLQQYQQAIRLQPQLKDSLRPAILHARLAEADRLAKLGRPDAESEYKDALKLDGGNASAHFGLGSFLLAFGKAGEAVPELRKAAQLDPASTDAALTLGLALYKSGHAEDARTQWRQLAASRDPRVSEEARGMLDQYLLAPAAFAMKPLNVQDLEVQRCRELVRNYPDQASTHNNLALALFHAKQKTEALQEVQIALHLNPDSVEAHTNLGKFLSDNAQSDAAVEEYQRALKLDSENGAVHNNLGAVYFNRQQWKKAEYEFRKALELDHGDGYAHHNLASVLLQEGRLQESINECAKTLRYDPSFAAAYATRGLVEDQLGQTALALADLKFAVRASENPAQALQDLENPLHRFAGRGTAVRQFRAILRLYPQTPEGEEALGRLLLANNEGEEAASEFRLVTQIQPERVTGHFLLARALLRLDRLDEAVAEGREALRLEPHSGEALNTLGLALYQAGKTDEGRQQWKTALTLDDKDAARNAAGLLEEFPAEKQQADVAKQ